jgi:hypothetical protein
MSDAREQPTPGAGGAGDVAEMRELLGNIDRMHTRAECHLIAIHAAFWPDEPRRWVPGEATAEGMKILNEVAKLIAERDALRAAVEKLPNPLKFTFNSGPKNRVRAAVSLIRMLADALRHLHDYQNGPPLPSYEKPWGEAMGKTEAVLAIAEPYCAALARGPAADGQG